jgi:hypothetical protein
LDKNLWFLYKVLFADGYSIAKENCLAVNPPEGGNQKIVWIKTTGFYTKCFPSGD